MNLSTEPATLIDGKYTILAKLREGGMGSIYKVNHNLLDEIRVIKFMRPHVTGDVDLQKRFLQEAKFVTKLKHRNIASVYDFAMGPDLTAYIVMEYIDGLNLAEILASFKRISVELVLEVARQTLDALSYLHRRNVVHRDISPDNIMVSIEDGFPIAKLIDLGIAKALDSEESVTKTGFFLGKLKYASPEQLGSLGSEGKIDARADLYSMAIVLFELLTGRLPFIGESAQALVAGHLFHAPPSFDDVDPSGRIPEQLREVLLKALAKQRDDRFASADDFMTALIRVQETLPGTTLRQDLERLQSLINEHHPSDETQHYTPSAQERMNQQFGASRTPSHGGSTLGASADATVIGASALRVLPTLSTTAASPDAVTMISAPLVQPTITVPLERRSKGRLWIAAAVVVIAVIAAVSIFLKNDAVPPPVVPAQTKSPEVALPVATESAAPATDITSSPPVVEASTTSIPPVELQPSSALTRAQSIAMERRAAAQRAGAPTAAAAAYRQASRTFRNAEQQLGAGNEAAAISSYGTAARQFTDSENDARREPARPLVIERRVENQTPPAPVPVVVNDPPVEHPAPPAERPAPARVIEQPRRSGEEGVRAAIAEYVAAQESLDAARYSRVYPGADQSRITTAFRSFRSQDLDLTIKKVSIDGDSALVQAHEARVASPKIGSEQRINSDRTFTLRRRGDGWVIASIK